jgi:hypothetical protein
MVCKRCGEAGAVDSAGLCEECAQQEVALSSGVVKASTIVVAVGDDTAVYRSIREVPAELRRKLRRATNSVNSATILIADKRGREQIARAMRKLPNTQKDAESRAWSPRVQQGVAVALIACTLILMLLVLTNRF